MGTKKNPGKFDCYENAAEDEPMFVLLARDPLAPLLVRKWAYLSKGQSKEKKAEAVKCAVDMKKWRDKKSAPGF